MVHIKPKLRFKGFNDDWERTELGNISTVTKLAGFEFTKYVNYSDKGNLIAIRGVNISNGKLDLTDVKYIDNSDFSKLKRSKLYKRDILFTYVGTLGKSSIISENDRFYLAPNVALIRLNNKKGAEFIQNLISMDDYYNHHILPLVTTSSQQALSMQSVRNFKINMPKSEKEQSKIGLFFNKIDALIELKFNKIESLESLKRGYLQKLFSDLNEHKPKLRFKGFNDCWSINKVKDLTIVNPKNTDYKDTFNYVDLNSVENGNLVSYRTEKYKNAPSRAKRIAKINDIFYQTVRPYQNNNLYFNVKSNKQFVFSTGYAQIRADKVNSKMLFYYFLKREFNQKVINLCTGTSFPAISSNDLANIKISVPKTAEEQSKIGDIMTLIDKQINVQKNELNRLKSIKKGYLQKMVV